MIGISGNLILWVKAAHVIFVIFWMAGLFMLPRFLAYHQEAGPDASEHEAWVEREKRLIRIILNPSILMVWIFGLILAFETGAYSQIWFQAKIVVVLGLSGYHFWMARYAGKLARREGTLSGKTLRLLNEVPGVAAALIVVLVIVRPF